LASSKDEKKDDKKVDTSGKSLADGHHRSHQMPAPGNRSRVFFVAFNKPAPDQPTSRRQTFKAELIRQPRRLAPSPIVILAVGIEHPFDVTV
jgi:hypothetical protein